MTEKTTTSSGWLELAARIGYASKGVVYLALGAGGLGVALGTSSAAWCTPGRVGSPCASP